LFSFGVVLYELVTGRLPFKGRSGPELIDHILHNEPASISRFVEEVPDEMVRIIRKLLAKDPEDRYQSAREVVVDLRRLKAELSGESRPPAEAPWVQSRRRRRMVLAAAFLGPAVALVLVVVYQVFRVDPGVQLRLEPITHTTAPGWEANPALSPDGHEVAYCAETDGNVDLWLMDSAGGQPLRLTDQSGLDCSPEWFPDGREILFVSDRTGTSSLWRVGRFGGTATLVLENAVGPAVSPDGSQIAFGRRDREGAGLTIWVAPLDNTGAARQLTPDGLGVWDHENPAFSPDGRTIAYADFQDVWLVPADGSTPPKRLTDGSSTHRDPAWLPDGRTLLMTSWREGTLALWTIGVDGSDLARVTPGTGPERQPALSFDGALVAYSTNKASEDVVVTDLVTGHRERLASSAGDGAPDLRADGGAVVFSSDRAGGGRHLWLQPLVGGRSEGNARQITSGPGRSAVPSFSHDGRIVAYYRIIDLRRELWVVPAQGGAPIQLTEGTPNDVSPSFSPNGRCLAFTRIENGGSAIWSLEIGADGAAGIPRPLVTEPADTAFPMWAPGGKRLAFLAEGDAWIVEISECPAPDAKSRRTVRITQGAEALDLAWGEDGGALLVSGAWGEGRLELRRISLDDSAAQPEFVMEIGDPRGEGTFGVSRDGRFVTTIDTDTRGDIWVSRFPGPNNAFQELISVIKTNINSSAWW
jgi:Tol biopolymer transport system component